MPTPTTRKYARTMQEAFPHDARNAYAIERYTNTASWLELIAGWAITFVLITMFIYALVEWAAQ